MGRSGPLPRFASSIAEVYADPSALKIDYRPRMPSGLSMPTRCMFAGRTEITGCAQNARSSLPAPANGFCRCPGWTLPGVTTAGGAQALLKSSGVVVGRKVAIAGTGPLLLQLASQLLAAGASISGIFEAASFRQWVATVARTLFYPPLALQGATLLATLVRRGTSMKIWLFAGAHPWGQAGQRSRYRSRRRTIPKSGSCGRPTPFA